MAQADIFLKLDGINGESLDSSHTNEIEILNASWGLANSGSAHYQMGSGSGKAQFQDFHLTKRVDKSSPILISACATGKPISTATLTFRKAGNTPLEYLVYDFTNVFISSVNQSSAGQDVSESISLNFQTYKVTYTPQAETGGGDATVDSGYDIAQNKTQ